MVIIPTSYLQIIKRCEVYAGMCAGILLYLTKQKADTMPLNAENGEV